MNKYVCHPNGNDLNGGGYDLSSYAGTWAQWHNNFAALVVQTGCSVGNNGSGKVRITSQGSTDLAAVPAFVIMYCDFNDATYEDGRYVVLTAGNDYVDISLDYVSDKTVNVRIGGAFLSPKEACAKGNGTSLDEVLFPCNQTTQTVNEVDGTANNITMATEEATLNSYGVDEATGIAITSEDSNDWPVIQAKTGSSWTANTALFVSTAAASSFKLDKIVFNGNGITPKLIQIGNAQNDVTSFDVGDIKITNAIVGLQQEGNVRSIYSVFGVATINSIVISDCVTGYYNYGGRPIPNIISFFQIDNCTYGINAGSIGLSSFNNCGNIILSNNDYGIYTDSRNYFQSNGSMLFVGNTVDVYLKYYNTTNYYYTFSNCLFFNSTNGGYIIATNNDAYIHVTLINCVLGDVNDASDMSRFSGITPTRIDCEYIQADPFVDLANGDLRLNRNAAGVSKIYDETKQINSIGATGYSEPVGGGVSASRIFGGL